jgi:hypothetical protein
MSRIQSYRGLIADDVIESIPLHTLKGTTGYRIVKFEAMYQNPAGLSGEGVMKIYSVPQTSTTATIDFSDPTLLGAAFIENNNSSSYFGGHVIVFDNVTFNQDIYITWEDNGANHACNYHIELEIRDLALDEATVATLKDIRNND